MKLAQALLRKLPEDAKLLAPLAALDPQLVLVFGAIDHLNGNTTTAALLAEQFPDAIRIGCSTAGEIAGTAVWDGSVAVTAIHFDATQLVSAATDLVDMADSRSAGERLGAALTAPDLKAVLVFGQGVGINGSALVEGMLAKLGPNVALSGGLAGDGGAFSQTWTLNDEGLSDRRLVAVGLKGEKVAVSHGCFGGWLAFGPSRKVTKAEGNVLYELDGEPALAVYKRYLGDYAKDLPSSGLLFPFEMLQQEGQPTGLIRTILGVDEATACLVLAGEIDSNGYLRLMHAQTDKLVDGAETAAEQAVRQAGCQSGPTLGLLVSCVGRKLVMGGRVDEEVEGVAAVLGQHAVTTGFYSYGEISPLLPGVGCALHNQTMTITCIGEAP